MISRHQLLACLVGAFLCSYLLGLKPASTTILTRFRDFSTTFLLLFIAAAAYNVLLYNRISPLRGLPTPVQQPLWRRLFKEPTPWLFEKWSKELPNDGLIRYFGIFNQERLLLTSSKGVRDVLATNPYDFHKQRAQKTHLEPVLGRGLVFVEGDTHRFHRKQMSPAFSTRFINKCQPIFWRKTLQIVDLFHRAIKLESQVGQASVEEGQLSGIVEVHEPVSRAALDIIGLAGCSFDFNSLDEDTGQTQMVRDYRKAFGVSSSNRIRCLLAHILPAWVVDRVPIQRNRDIALVTNLVRQLAWNIIGLKRRLDIKNTNPDILDKTMQSGGFADEVLVEQVKTLLAAGHDTTSSTLASVAAVLSQPRFNDVQERLREEIRENLPSLSNSNLASSNIIENMPYLNAVRNETFRLFPPFSWFFRRSVVDTTVCGHRVPKDTDIILCPWAMHRSTEFWGPDAEEFNPKRWLKDPSGRGGARDPYCFVTFGAGPRVCIAERFARNEVSTLMAGIFGRFRVEEAEGEIDSPLSHQLTLTRIGGVKVRMTLLEGW